MSLNHEEICPKCGSKHIRKFGKIYLKNEILQKFRCLRCKYVWHKPFTSKIPQKMFELILEMLKKFIRDIDLGKDKTHAGWIPLNDENVRDIQKLNFCEVDPRNMVGRINPDGEIPNDIFMTEEGLIFFDCINSLKVIEELWQSSKDVKEYHNIIVTGLKFMFKNAHYSFWEKEKGAIPENIRSIVLSPKWIKVARDLSEKLADDFLEAMFGEKHKGDNNITLKVINERFNSETILKNEVLKSQWSRVITYFHEQGEILEFLGLIWYANNKAVENKIEYEGAKIRIFEEVIKIITNKRQIAASELREKLKSVRENLDRLMEEDKWGLNWCDIFTIPQ